MHKMKYIILGSSWALFRLRDGNSHAFFYALLGGLSICLLVFLTPPFEVPDEPQHFYRSYQLSHFNELDRIENSRIDTDLPASIPALVEHFMGTTKFHTTREAPQRSLSETFQKLGTPLNEAQRVSFDFAGIQSYSPLPYMPQALTIAVARSMGAGPLELLYAGRLANALSAIIIATLAISLLPLGRTFALVIALLPMTQFQTASVSPDALTISAAFLFTALTARFLAKLNWSWKQQLAALIAGLLMCAVKPVLAPLLFAGLWLGSHMRNTVSVSARRVFLTQLIFAIITVSLTAAWFLLAPKAQTPSTGGQLGVSAAGQIAYLMENPLTALRIPLRSLYVHSTFLWHSAVGKLGWLTVPLSNWVYIASAIAMFLSLYSEQSKIRINASSSIWMAVLVAAAIILIELALYITWTPVGEYSALGVQGRYFLPALPMFGIAATSWSPGQSYSKYRQRAYCCVLAIIVATTISMHRTIIEVYGLF